MFDMKGLKAKNVINKRFNETELANNAQTPR